MLQSCALLALLSVLSFGTASAEDWPARNVTMIVPFPPGGVADITARPLAESMGRILKQPVIVENRAGAGGGVGMQYVARAKADVAGRGLVATVVQNYYTLVAAGRKAASAQQSLREAQQFLDITQRQENGGFPQAARP